jgi:hypothetical protein
LLAASCGPQVVQLDSPAPTGGATNPECISVMQPPGLACVYCGAKYDTARACLKCDTPTEKPGCTACFWSDMPQVACKSCIDAAGAASTMGCDELRKDLLEPAP